MEENKIPPVEEEQISAEQVDISLFIKIGIIVLSIMVVIGLGMKYLPKAITVSNTSSKRDLPIYCVKTDDKKVALTFDAAWVNGRVCKII